MKTYIFPTLTSPRKMCADKDPGVEFARILGCLLVVGCHSCPQLIGTANPNFCHVFTGMCCADGVAVFWLILGFFLFRQNDFRRLCSRTASRILVPLFAVSGLVVLLRIIAHPHVAGLELIGALKSVALWSPVANAGHLWFLYAYILVVLSFPAMSGIVSCLNGKSESGKWVLLATSIVLAENTLSGNRLLHFSGRTIGALFPSATFVIIGHFLYKKRDFLVHYGLFAPLVFLAVNVFRTVFYRWGLSRIVYWNTCSGLICSCSIVSFAFAATSRIEGLRLKSILCTVATFTFPIYLLHPYSILLLRRLNLGNEFIRIFHTVPFFPHEFVYTISMSIVATVSCLICAAGFNFGKKLLRCFFHKILCVDKGIWQFCKKRF